MDSFLIWVLVVLHSTRKSRHVLYIISYGALWNGIHRICETTIQYARKYQEGKKSLLTIAGEKQKRTNPLKERERCLTLSNLCGYGTVRYEGTGRVAYKPELNPTEHLWEDIREQWFPNLVFKSIAAVEDTLVEGLVSLERDAVRVAKLTGFKWIISAIKIAT